jgi:hypothetical protein
MDEKQISEDIDCQIAIKIMGWTIKKAQPSTDFTQGHPDIWLDKEGRGTGYSVWEFNTVYYPWSPSKRQMHTFDVEKVMRKKGWLVDIHSFGEESWYILIHKGNIYLRQYGDLSKILSQLFLEAIEKETTNLK